MKTHQPSSELSQRMTFRERLKIKHIYPNQDEEQKEKPFNEEQKYPYPRLARKYFNTFDLNKLNDTFKLLSVGGQQHVPPKYSDNIHKDKENEPIKYPNLRFQLCSAKVSIDRYSALKETLFEEYYVYGYIAVSDKYVSREDGWVPLNEPMYRFALVFKRGFHEPVPITNTSFLYYITDPSTHRSVSPPTIFEFQIELFAFNKEVDDEFFCVAYERIAMDFSNPKTLNCPMNNLFNGPDGCVELNYIIFTDAVDAVLDITFKEADSKSTVSKNTVWVKIFACYGDEIEYNNDYEKDHFYISVFPEECLSLLDNTKFQLMNSVFAVSAKGSLIINAYIGDSFGNVIISGILKFDAKHEGRSTGSIMGKDCSLDMNVNWKY